MSTFKTTPVPRVKNISKEDFIKNYYKPQKPVLIEGLTKDWPAYEKWTTNLPKTKRVYMLQKKR